MNNNPLTWIENAEKRLARAIQIYGGTTSIGLPKHPNGGYVLNFDTPRSIGQIVVWPTGSVDVLLVDVFSEADVVNKTHTIKTEKEMNDVIMHIISVLAERESTRESPDLG